MGATTANRQGQEHQSSGGHVFHYVHGLGEQSTDHKGRSCVVKGCNIMTVCCRRIQPLLMVAIEIPHKLQRVTHILTLHGSH